MEELKKLLEKLGFDGEIAKLDPDQVPPEIKKALSEIIDRELSKTSKGREVSGIVKQVSGFLMEFAKPLAATTVALKIQSKGRPYYNLTDEEDKLCEQVQSNLKKHIAVYMSPPDTDTDAVNADVSGYASLRALNIAESMLRKALADIAVLRKQAQYGNGPDISPSAN